MTPTEELRNRVRRMLDERIPTGGEDSDTRFTDEEIDDLLEYADTIHGAVSQGWLEKAGMYQREMGEVEETRTGQETYKLTKLKERMEYALAMSQRYGAQDADEKSKGTSTSVILGVRPARTKKCYR